MPNPRSHPTENPRLAGRSSAALLFAAVVLAVAYQWKLLDYMEWGDESETVVTAKMLAAGMSLYDEVFNHHGPLIFLPGLVLESFGDFSVGAHRIPIAALQWLALLSIYRSPMLKLLIEKRIFLTITLIAMVGLLPESGLFGHAYIYQSVAGLLTVIALAQYSTPALVEPDSLRPWQVALGNLLLASLPFLAVTYLPAAVLLVACSLRRRFLRTAAAGLVLGIFLNLVFLGIVGSFKGFWVDHIYINSTILPMYNDGQGPVKLAEKLLGTLTVNVERFVVFIGLAAGCAMLVRSEKRPWPWRSVLLTLAVLSFLMRGNLYQGVPFWYACLALFALLMARNLLWLREQYVWLCFTAVFVLRLVYPLTIGGEFFVKARRPNSTEFSRLVQDVTDKNDRIIAFSFQNHQYIAAGRLPASGSFFYLPWQQKYLENPRLGIAIDTCAQIKSYSPKIMLIDKWKVWGKFAWDTYADCVQQFINQKYRQVPGRPYYIRIDLYDHAMSGFKHDPQSEFARTLQ